MRKGFLTILFAMAGIGLAVAQEGVHLNLKARASVAAYAPGESFYVAARGEIPAPWHAYYRNPGSVGLGMTAQLSAPEGFEVQGPYWSVPQKLEGSGSVSYGYEAPLVVWRVQSSAIAGDEPARFVVTASAQLCSSESCLPPQESRAELTVPRGNHEPNPAWQGEESAVETLGDTSLPLLTATREGAKAILRFRKPGKAEGAAFISDDGTVLPDGAQTLSGADGTYELELPLNDGSNPLYPSAQRESTRLVGILTFADGAHTRVDVPLERAGAGGFAAPAGFWGIVGGLLVGGLLLNLMPCVFPVLGLKVMGFVELSGGSRGKVAAHSLSFTAGVLVSFCALGILLIALSHWDELLSCDCSSWLNLLLNDSGGTGRTWAVWMQNEWVVYTLTLLLAVLGLWMVGVFELGERASGVGAQLQSRGGLLGSFFQGLLVTVVATPCSAPFIGAALPAALALPGCWMLGALSAMALGLSLPYISLSLFPSLVNLLPRPGEWMISLRQALSFFLFAAAAWLVGVYLSLNPGGTSILTGLVLVAAGCWAYGRWCALWRGWLCRICGGVVALLLVGGGVWFSLPGSLLPAWSAASSAANDRWQTWSPQLVEQALDDDRPVFVDFTAKWCATCQVNKALAYTPEIYALFDKHHVLLLRADNTRPNPEIDAELHKLHRGAVPTNVLYLPNDPEPAVTRELLTADYLLNFLREKLE